MGNGEGRFKPGSSRSVILLQVTVLIIIVFLVFGIVGIIGNRRSQNNLAEASKEKVIEEGANTISSAAEYTISLVYDLIISRGGAQDLAMTQGDLASAIMNKEETDLVKYGNERLNELVEKGVYGLDMAFVALPEIPPIIDKPMIIMSSKPGVIFEEVSEDLLSFTEGKECAYKLFEDGIPELGLEGAHLLIVSTVNSELTSGQYLYIFLVKPMQEQLDALNDYYKKENNNATLFMLVLTVICIVILVFITFFVLSYLIRKKITRPIDELEVAAEKVIEGDLDVEVPLRKGEEFSNLKKAFNQMITSIRDVINKATGE